MKLPNWLTRVSTLYLVIGVAATIGTPLRMICEGHGLWGNSLVIAYLAFGMWGQLRQKGL